MPNDTMTPFWHGLAGAIGAAGTVAHVDRMIDVIAATVPHDLVTVTRYSATARPEFVRHRHFSDEMVERYLDTYYVVDPFFEDWRTNRRVGVLPLRQLASTEVKRGRYIAEFLAQSEICDEVGVLLGDGEDWCLGIFLDRRERPFRAAEIAALAARWPVFEALQGLDLKARTPRAPAPHAPSDVGLPATLWPSLSARERELVRLILSGLPTAAIARRLDITVGTTKNHKRRIYAKLDITTERELFVEFFQHRGDD